MEMGKDLSVIMGMQKDPKDIASIRSMIEHRDRVAIQETGNGRKIIGGPLPITIEEAIVDGPNVE